MDAARPDETRNCRSRSAKPRMTLLVDAETHEPLEWTIVSDDGTRVTSRFETYELLPATPANLALLSLRAQRPDAPVQATLRIEGVGGRK